jgi:hypothetical protein
MEKIEVSTSFNYQSPRIILFCLLLFNRISSLIIIGSHWSLLINTKLGTNQHRDFAHTIWGFTMLTYENYFKHLSTPPPPLASLNEGNE